MKEVTLNQNFSVNNEWRKYSKEFVVADNSWKFYLVLKSQDGKIDFDQVELKIKIKIVIYKNNCKRFKYKNFTNDEKKIFKILCINSIHFSLWL